MSRATQKNHRRWIRQVVQAPKPLLACTALLIVLAASGLPRVTKDPSVDAFVPRDHPAAVARDRAAEVFGLEDPVIVGLAWKDGRSAFTPDALHALAQLDESVRTIEGVKRRDVISLASQNAILSSDGDLLVEPVVDYGDRQRPDAELAWQRFLAMPMLSGVLASPDGDMLVLIVPVEDPNHAAKTVSEITESAHRLAPPDMDVHVAGVAAMNARLSQMVDADTRIFVPAAIVTVLMILWIALRRLKALLGPMLVIAGSAAIAIGGMGWLGAHYYLITTALPVVIMAIAVADTLHLSTYYLAARARNGSLTATAASAEALHKAWMPITLTSITTIAAFIGLSFGAAMQPISEFGVFAAVGVAAAWLLSLTALPAIFILCDLCPSERHASIAREGWTDRMVRTITDAAFTRPWTSLLVTAASLLLFGHLATHAEFDYERQRYFTADDAVLQADQAINGSLGGVNFLDVVVTSEAPDGLMTPEALAAIQDLRVRMTRLPFVANVSGIDEYLSHMHRLLTDAPAHSLPTDPRAPGQYLFLYEASGAPEDFKREIDYAHQQALVRAQLSTDAYRRTRGTVADLGRLIADWQQEHQIAAAVSGRVAVNTGWMDQLSRNHMVGLALALTLVFLTTLAVFRSAGYAVVAMVPVAVGVVSVYATMGLFGLDIAPATSMTAAIATGLGVDFGIHLNAMIRQQRQRGLSTFDAFSNDYLIVARACVYSALALGVALAVICVSSAPVLRWFGFLVSMGAFGSLLGALVVVPALWSVVYNTVERNTSYALSF